MMSWFAKRCFTSSTLRGVSMPPRFFVESLGPKMGSGSSSPVAVGAPPAPSAPLRSRMKDLAFLVLSGTLCYIAYDSYTSKAALQKEYLQYTKEQQKAMGLAQILFNNLRKKRELQIFNEKAVVQKREMKMALHIGLLRKQLQEAGIEPVAISKAIEEFEKNVKMDMSSVNISGMRLWLEDGADISAYVPDAHVYDTK